MEEYYSKFISFCGERRLVCKIPETKYLEMREEYLSKLNWWKEVQKCINWLYDRDLRVISRARLRNWMNNAVRYQKEAELKQQQKYADKQKHYMPPVFVYKQEKIWQPPT